MEKEIDRDLPLKKEISQNIERLKKEKGINQIRLSELSGISKSTLSDYKNCKTLISPGNVEKLANVFKVTKSDIDPTFNLGSVSNLIPVQSDIVKIPILGEIACGDPILVQENYEGYRHEPAEMLPRGDVFYLKAKGDSMEPTIPNGSYVLIREQPDVEYGQIAAVLVNGSSEVTLKRVKHQGNTVILTPDNPKYSPYIITADNPARIIGKAVRFTQDL